MFGVGYVIVLGVISIVGSFNGIFGISMSAVYVTLIVLLLGILTLMPGVYGSIFVKCVFFPRKLLVHSESIMTLSLSVNMFIAYAYNLNLYLNGFNVCVL